MLDIETYESWHRHEADRLVAAAAGVFDALCRTAEANGDADGAIAAAERLLALDPLCEDWQRTALKLVARHSGREAALSRAKSLAELLRNELDVAPEPETRALIAAIERGEFAPAQATPQTQPALRDAVRPVSVPDPTPLLIAPREVALPSVAAAPAAPATQTSSHFAADDLAVLASPAAARGVAYRRRRRARRHSRSGVGNATDLIAAYRHATKPQRRRAAFRCRWIAASR